MVKACFELFQKDKNPSDEDMRCAVYAALVEAHPDEVAKVESAKGGWNKYWTEVLQSTVICFNYC
jgi:hypothetical protein